MDPVSQAVVGAVIPQSVAKSEHLLAACFIGALAGMAPDLDVLIRSTSDPLLFLEYHRQFSHSLIFIPIGGLIMALLLHPLIGRRNNLDFRHTLLFATLGFATHGLLDACTTYGTQLLWPFSNERISWNIIGIIDPLFTLPVLGLAIAAVVKRNPKWARVAVVWALIYLTVGALQRERAEQFASTQATARGHAPLSLSAKPTIANLWLWKTIYEFEGQFYVDSVHIGLNSTWYPGENIQRLTPDQLPTCISSSSQQRRDIDRFNWFSQSFTALQTEPELRIIDVRYSLVPNEIKPLWGITLDCYASLSAHAQYFTSRDLNTPNKVEFIRQIKGE
ncbi:metal-dependent hydrolase [Umboniibacter marinipuniceus]|uniref:Inner membrane protein n=1 Tax=Umboniibacter marinipuniceus TaxID=569599 RepID=A0A3M0A269_9GAMM|nr:metal-dependent hydrolase [Umboniibacter marinipuniceus]RMA78746.1 inner membrane protein [Umboniibacter marinipuniceus]